MYILASRKNNTLYIGVTANLVQRIYQHKQGSVDGFTLKYKVTDLVYYEYTGNIREAILREKHLKKWNRQWKINLIEKDNPFWKDLSDDIV